LQNQEDKINIKGQVLEAMPNTQFKVELEDGRIIIAVLAGKMRMNRIRVMPGDAVEIEMTKYDESKGRIVYRGK
jgi:translation initiation factor IF-1